MAGTFRSRSSDADICQRSTVDCVYHRLAWASRLLEAQGIRTTSRGRGVQSSSVTTIFPRATPVEVAHGSRHTWASSRREPTELCVWHLSVDCLSRLDWRARTNSQKTRARTCAVVNGLVRSDFSLLRLLIWQSIMQLYEIESYLSRDSVTSTPCHHIVTAKMEPVIRSRYEC
jgi:hypothetical protein